MIKKLSKRDQRSKANVFTKGSIGQIDENGLIVLVVELFLLQDRV